LVREAVDFLRYYAAEAEKAEAGTEARGVIACISPWNFPLAIFTGQVAAALVTGNAVVAKPAEQTPLIAARAVELLRKAGVPEDVLSCCRRRPVRRRAADGRSAHRRRVLHRLDRGGQAYRKATGQDGSADAMLIAETGRLNAMIVDSTALPEQAVRDILASSFQSAGQRCSALRILYVQKDVEKKVLEMLEGAMNALNIGDPWELATDVGPVIDTDAQKSIKAYCADLEKAGKLIAKLDAPADGRFVAPHVFRVKGIEEMDREIFGPVLHVATFKADDVDRVISSINKRATV
jgi:RHH-type proline utilization regulon transcriptional repressor/proline dehydrogenase/delta 1-pyrroline-5-carboxylate dehydrogenase